MQRNSIYGSTPAAPATGTKRNSRDAVPTYWIDVDLEDPPPAYSRKKSGTTPSAPHYPFETEEEDAEIEQNSCRSWILGTIACIVGVAACAYLIILLIIALLILLEVTKGNTGIIPMVVKLVYMYYTGQVIGKFPQIEK